MLKFTCDRGEELPASAPLLSTFSRVGTLGNGAPEELRLPLLSLIFIENGGTGGGSRPAGPVAAEPESAKPIAYGGNKGGVVPLALAPTGGLLLRLGSDCKAV